METFIVSLLGALLGIIFIIILAVFPLIILTVIAAYRGCDLIGKLLEDVEGTKHGSCIYMYLSRIGFIKRHRERKEKEMLEKEERERDEIFNEALKDPKVQEKLKNGTIVF